MLANTLERVGPGVVTVGIPWEPLGIGPRGARVVVTDFDGGRFVDQVAAHGFYEPINLDSTKIAMQAGLPPTEGDPRFHQQMVYAVAMRTMEAFDKALGRRVRPVGGRLRLYPHAFRGENAYYDPELRSVLFGYFQADPDNPGKNIPGQFIFTALSGDIIAHEVTHALIHRIRPGLLDRTNRDVAAFHEAMADITAIFLHFTLPGVVEETIAATRGELGYSTPLNDLAGQFGYATGRAAPSARPSTPPTRLRTGARWSRTPAERSLSPRFSMPSRLSMAGGSPTSSDWRQAEAEFWNPEPSIPTSSHAWPAKPSARRNRCSRSA
ncbi:MAG: hypothetical protein H0V07_00705 [Propionibacteriales bacterium]|nr:hypothetical protein [Propionibacteriales bacterium]